MKIFAVGNSLYGDDGIGEAVLREIRERGLVPEAELIDVGTDALALIDHFDETDSHVIIDAARMGLPPGRVQSFAPDEARLKIRWDHLSLHGFGLAETFAMAEGIGRMPTRLRVVGVEPVAVEIDRGLSAEVAAAVPEVIETILSEVQGDGETDNPGD